MDIRPITFEQISDIWRKHLWPDRQSLIEAHSWIDFQGSINVSLTLGPPSFWGAFDNREICGVISGYSMDLLRYRSRGLWVNSKLRGLGYGSKLLNQVQNQAKLENRNLIWTMPRLTAWEFYRKNGFIKLAEITSYEYGPHILAEANIPLNKGEL